MPLRGVATRTSAIPQLQARRLVIVFQNIIIALHLVDAPQFNVLALKRDSSAHFHRRIAPTDIGNAAAHFTRLSARCECAEYMPLSLGISDCGDTILKTIHPLTNWFLIHLSSGYVRSIDTCIQNSGSLHNLIKRAVSRTWLDIFEYDPIGISHTHFPTRCRIMRFFEKDDSLLAQEIVPLFD